MFEGLSTFLAAYPNIETLLWVVGILLLALLSHNITKRILLRILTRIVAHTPFTWDDILQKRFWEVFREFNPPEQGLHAPVHRARIGAVFLRENRELVY